MDLYDYLGGADSRPSRRGVSRNVEVGGKRVCVRGRPSRRGVSRNAFTFFVPSIQAGRPSRRGVSRNKTGTGEIAVSRVAPPAGA